MKEINQTQLINNKTLPNVMNICTLWPSTVTPGILGFSCDALKAWQ